MRPGIDPWKPHTPKRKTRWGLVVLLGLTLGFGGMLALKAYQHPGLINGGYPGYWYCDESWCGLFMETPDGPMAYPVPPTIRNEIESQRVNTIKV